MLNAAEAKYFIINILSQSVLNRLSLYFAIYLHVLTNSFSRILNRKHKEILTLKHIRASSFHHAFVKKVTLYIFNCFQYFIYWHNACRNSDDTTAYDIRYTSPFKFVLHDLTRNQHTHTYTKKGNEKQTISIQTAIMLYENAALPYLLKVLV